MVWTKPIHGNIIMNHSLRIVAHSTPSGAGLAGHFGLSSYTSISWYFIFWSFLCSAILLLTQKDSFREDCRSFGGVVVGLWWEQYVTSSKITFWAPISTLKQKIRETSTEVAWEMIIIIKEIKKRNRKSILIRIKPAANPYFSTREKIAPFASVNLAIQTKSSNFLATNIMYFMPTASKRW